MHSRLLIGLLIANVLLRTFTNGWRILPKILNVIDIPIVLSLFAISLLYRSGAPCPVGDYRSINRRLIAFCMVLIFGALLNSDYLVLQPLMSQVTMLLLPLILVVSVLNLPFSTDEILKYGRVLWKLVILELAIGILQLPGRIVSGQSEDVHGTFTGNAEQYGAFSGDWDLLLGRLINC